VSDAIPADAARTALLDFYRGRLEHLGEAAGLRLDSVRAALGTGADDPRDAWLRMKALDAARAETDFEALVLAYRRIKNILAGHQREPLRREDLRDKAEIALDRAVREAGPALDVAQRKHDYAAGLRQIDRLRGELERFFDEVLVMAPEAAVRAARLALLQSIADLFLRVGDFSEIVLLGEPAAVAAKRARPRSPRTGKEL
jgi:glycyl-tRNA synthetase beta chain